VPARTAATQLATSARLGRVARAGQELREPEPKAGRPVRGGADAPAPLLPGSQPPTPAAETPRAAALGPPARAAAPLPADPNQTSLGGAILPGGAHLRLESEGMGDLALHLRVRDGVAHLRVEGEQAGQLVGRGQELQRALAAEGLKLGQLEVERPPAPSAALGDGARTAGEQGQAGGQPGQPQDRPDRDPGPAAQGAGPATSARRPTGRATAHHVEA
jgi:hypothetical protein